MDKRLKAKWVKALMSGEYQQGCGQLVSPVGFCCLGVLAEVTGFRSTSTNWLKNNNSCATFISIEVQRGLAKLNDERIPFPVIAGFIQENL